MEIKVTELVGWTEVLSAARITARKMPTGKEPSQRFKESIIAAEHSPIRNLIFKVEMLDIKRKVAMHLVRHNIGAQPFVSTSREDRGGLPDSQVTNETLVNMEMILNAQSLINISKERLCTKASLETRIVWERVIAEVGKIEPELYEACVRKCVYRGFCPESNCCGYCLTSKYDEERISYVDIMTKNQNIE